VLRTALPESTQGLTPLSNPPLVINSVDPPPPQPAMHGAEVILFRINELGCGPKPREKFLPTLIRWQ
jgi:hypothetical protein